jgi:hypothetical protein
MIQESSMRLLAKDVFKRARGGRQANPGLEGEAHVSDSRRRRPASMYRFNSYDGRLERLLEATDDDYGIGDDERFNKSCCRSWR